MFSPSVNNVLEFLLYEFKSRNNGKGLGHSAMNTRRSALSSVVRIDGKPAGQHSLVTRFPKAVFNKQPTLPRNTITWDAEQVLHYLKGL